MDEQTPRWFKSSYSAAVTCCVEVALTRIGVRVRDSEHPEGRDVGIATAEWVALVCAVRGSEPRHHGASGRRATALSASAMDRSTMATCG
ncbi:DUF397 domain-containing protein [Nocardiopsis sp. EMB25]|uniref:DUF397 domain-containing protein n=1 Tax=Nocardiopsis sp. EMB25 TaxID=2835867 RepID=UPI003FA34645